MLLAIILDCQVSSLGLGRPLQMWAVLFLVISGKLRAGWDTYCDTEWVSCDGLGLSQGFKMCMFRGDFLVIKSTLFSVGSFIW